MVEEQSPMDMYKEFIDKILDLRMHYKYKLLEVDKIISKLNCSGLPYLINMTEEDETFAKRNPS